MTANETAAEIAAEDVEYFTVPLCDEELRVLAPDEWRKSASKALLDGDFDLWAEGALYKDEDVEVWEGLDPTMREIREFFEAFNEKAGLDSGKLQNSKRSSRRTRRR